MSKRLQQTPEIVSRIQRVYGDNIDTAALAVYECVALNTAIIRQYGTVFEGAFTSEKTLLDMAAEIQKGEGLPLQVVHNLKELPYGKVFWGYTVKNEAGATELRMQFYVSPSEVDIIRKIDEGTLDQVSINYVPAHMYCSECGYDYRGDAADEYRLWLGECPEGHVLGKGAHLNLDGMHTWFELSLVGRGGATGAKIIPANQADKSHSLAADGKGGGFYVILTAGGEDKMTTTQQQGQGGGGVKTDPPVTTSPAVEPMVALSAFNNLNSQIIANGVEIARLTSEGVALKAAVADGEAKLKASEAKYTADMAATLTHLKDQFTKLNVALGTVNPTVPEAVTDLIKGITEAQTKLSSLVPVGGVSNPADNGKGTDVLPVSLSAFKIKE